MSTPSTETLRQLQAAREREQRQAMADKWHGVLAIGLTVHLVLAIVVTAALAIRCGEAWWTWSAAASKAAQEAEPAARPIPAAPGTPAEAEAVGQALGVAVGALVLDQVRHARTMEFLLAALWTAVALGLLLAHLRAP